MSYGRSCTYNIFNKVEVMIITRRRMKNRPRENLTGTLETITSAFVMWERNVKLDTTRTP